MIRRPRTLLGAVVVTLAMGVGLAGPASAASITPIKPIKPLTNTTPIKPPPVAPTGPRIPFKGWSASKIKNASVKAGLSASSVRVKVTMLGDGETVTMDGSFAKNAAVWRMSSNKQGSLDLRRVGNRLFLAADAKMLLSGNDGGSDDLTPDQAALFAGKWFEATGNTKELMSAMTVAYWVNPLKAGTFTKRVAGKKIAGKSTVGLFGTGANGGLLYVASSGKPYPMFLESYDRTSTLSYSNWNKKVSVPVPAVITKITL